VFDLYTFSGSNGLFLCNSVQREIACRSDALGVKMRSEEEVMILQEQLEAARKALSCSRAECSGTETLLGRKVPGQENRHADR